MWGTKTPHNDVGKKSGVSANGLLVRRWWRSSHSGRSHQCIGQHESVQLIQVVLCVAWPRLISLRFFGEQPIAQLTLLLGGKKLPLQAFHLPHDRRDAKHPLVQLPRHSRDCGIAWILFGGEPHLVANPKILFEGAKVGIIKERVQVGGGDL